MAHRDGREFVLADPPEQDFLRSGIGIETPSVVFLNQRDGERPVVLADVDDGGVAVLFLEFKVIGGGKVLDMALDVGARNAEFVRQFLKTEGFTIAAEDLGDSFARKLFYSPKTGKVRVKRLTSTVNRAVFERERQSEPSAVQVESGSVELF